MKKQVIQNADLPLNQYDIILLGENHTSEKNSREESRLIKKLKPEIILLEGFSDASTERSAKHLTYLDSKLKDNFEIAPNKIPKKWERKKMYEFSSKNAEKLLRYIEKNHPEDFSLNPLIDYLSDKLYSAYSFRKHKPVEILNRTLTKKDYTIAGCDLSKEKKLKGKVENRKKTISQRNIRMGEKAIEYADRRQNKEKPIIQIVGRNHLKESSEIYETLSTRPDLKYKSILLGSKLDEIDATYYKIHLDLLK